MLGSGRIFDNDLVLWGTRVEVIDGQLKGERATVIDSKTNLQDWEPEVWIHYDRTGEKAGKPGDRGREILQDGWMWKTRLRRLPKGE